jgi:hypothetical protein
MTKRRLVSSKNPVRSPLLRPGALGLALAGLLSVLVSAAPSDAARVRGRVVGFRLLRNPVWLEAQDPSKHLFSFREAVPTVPAEIRQPYPHIPKELCLAALAATPQKAPPPVLIRVGGGRTIPVTIVVPPMTQLSFQNTDPFGHRLYGVGLSTFPPGDTMRGGRRDWTVPAPGVYEIRDEVAPSLRMWVVAEPNVASIGYPSLKGEFALNLDQPGEYQVQAYFAGKPVGPARVVKIDQKDLDISNAPVEVAKAPPPSDKKAEPDQNKNSAAEKK